MPPHACPAGEGPQAGAGATGEVVITGTGLLCPAARCAADLLPRPDRPGGGCGDSGPGDRGGQPPCGAVAEPWFDPARYLGRHGWKYASPAGRYLLAAAELALRDAGLEPRRQPPESMGVAVGTNLAAEPVLAGFDTTVIMSGSGALSPAEAPNFSVNMPASQVSMRHAMRAFNLSLTNPVVAGLEAILVLSSALRAGRARAGLAGAVEDRPAAASALPAAVRAEQAGPRPAGQAAVRPDERPLAASGACCFSLELAGGARARGASARAAVAGGFSRFLPPAAVAAGPEGAPGVWEQAVGRPLAGLAATGPPGDVMGGAVPFALIPGSAALGESLADYCQAWCRRFGLELVRTRYHGGDGSHYTVSALLAAAGLIAAHGRGLVMCASPHGHVAAVYLSPVRKDEW